MGGWDLFQGLLNFWALSVSCVSFEVPPGFNLLFKEMLQFQSLPLFLDITRQSITS